MASFSYVSKDKKNFSNILNIDKTQKIYSYNPDIRQVTIFEYKPDKKYDISIYIFIDILNTIITSKNALCICNSIYCDDIDLRQKSLNFGLTYKNIFNGDNKTTDARNVLDLINCDIKPRLNNKTYNSIVLIKWKIYEINEKNKKINKNNRFDETISEWIGLLAGLVLYFDELDVINYNASRYSEEICRPLTVKDI